MKAHSLVISALCAMGLTLSANAATPISYSTAGATYLQDFNTLPSTGTNPTYSGIGPFDVPTSTGGILDGWSFYKASGSGTNALFSINNGGSNSGATYSYGSTDSTERALGSLASGSTISTFGASFMNDSTSILSSITLSFTGEQWRFGGSAVVNTLAFSFGLGTTSISAGAFTAETNLDFASPILTNPDPTKPTTGTALDGNLPANQTAVSYTINGLFWTPGTALTIRWADTNDTGNDQGLAIDNLSFSAAAGTFRSLTWNATGGVWDTTTANWTGDGTVFQTGDIVHFQDDHLGVVTIDAGGVTPAQVNVGNTTGTYSFEGGALLGSAQFVKTGAGDLSLSAESQLTGGLSIEGGTVFTTADERLADTGSVTISAGAKLNLQDHLEKIGALVLKGGTADSGAGGILTVAGEISISGGADTSTIAGTLETLGGTGKITVVDGAAATDLQLDATLTGGRLDFAGTGTVAITADNSSFSGGVSVDGARLVLSSKNALGSASVFFNGGTMASIVPLTGADAIAQNVSIGGNVTIDGTNAMEFSNVSTSFGNASKVTTILGDVTFSGVIGNGSTTSGVLNKAGSGTLTLSAANTYSGGTTVQLGILKLTGAGSISGSSSVRVDSGATLDLATLASSYNIPDTQTLRGGGTVIAPSAGLTVTGALAPGGTATGFFTQTLTLQGGPLSLDSTAVLQMELGGIDAGSFDALVLIGQMLALDGTLDISLIGGYVPSASDTFTIITSDGGFSGQFANLSAGRVSFSGGSFLLTKDATTIVLSDYSAVPEPGTFALLGAAALAIAGLALRRRTFERCS